MEHNHTEDWEIVSQGQGRIFGYHSPYDNEISGESQTLNIGQYLDYIDFDENTTEGVVGQARVVGYQPLRIGYIAPQINAVIKDCSWCGATATRHRSCGCGEPGCVEWLCGNCNPV